MEVLVDQSGLELNNRLSTDHGTTLIKYILLGLDFFHRVVLDAVAGNDDVVILAGSVGVGDADVTLGAELVHVLRVDTAGDPPGIEVEAVAHIVGVMADQGHVVDDHGMVAGSIGILAVLAGIHTVHERLIHTVDIQNGGTLVGVNGPSTPSVPNWSVSNGTLTITYTYMDQVEAFLRSGICYIETQVVPGPENVYPYRNYAIRVIVY